MSSGQVTTRPSATGWLCFPRELEAEPSRELVGGKAWSLWRMMALGLRVPPAFVITTEACAAYFDQPPALPPGLEDDLVTGIRHLEAELGRTFGGEGKPLLVSVRSGSAVSMPGMMDTILDLGMNDVVEQALATESGDPEFAREVHRRFCAFYGRHVLGCLEDLEELPSLEAVRSAIVDEVGVEVPADPWQQLREAVAAVFRSSRSRRAVTYRVHYGLPEDLGTAVTVQAMVFGNLDDRSGTGVLFTRSPVTGEPAPYGEFLPRAQGEDVVSGRVTPRSLDELAAQEQAVHAELLEAARRLEQDAKDAQDIEFTVQHGTLYLLQTRTAKRTARAAVRIAVDLVDEGLLTPDEAVDRVTADQARTLLRPHLDEGAAEAAEVVAKGTPASPGVATGVAVATPEEAQAAQGAILVRRSTSPDDVHGMLAAGAVVTEHGGATSHAAVVSRALDLPCVVGCGDGTVEQLVGRLITVDGQRGRIFEGEVPTESTSEEDDEELARLARWAEDLADVTVVGPTGSVPDPVCDADSLPPEALGDGPPTVPPGTAAVRGSVFCTDEGVRAALGAGVRTIAAPHRLPVLLSAIAAGARRR